MLVSRIFKKWVVGRVLMSVSVIKVSVIKLRMLGCL